jgi:glycosyltransferase involved in cell wall biosynthesis
MKKRIIISNYDDLKNPYYAGGGSRAIHETAVRLSRKFAVTVLTGTYPGAKHGRVEGITYRRVGISFGGPKLGQLLFQLVLPYYVRTLSYDLWLESFTPPFSTGLLQLFTAKPVVGLVHMLAGVDMKRKYHLPFDLVEHLGLRTYRTFIATGDYAKQQILQANPEASVTVIPNGVTLPPRFVRRKPRHILFLGRIEVNQKGLDLLLRAYKKIASKTSYPLVIAGGGEEKQVRLLKQLIAEAGLTDRVQYVGAVEGQAKIRLLQKAACLVVPSRFETFSLVALEAIAAGIPLVSFRIPGLSWVPSGAGITVPTFKESSLGAAMHRVTMLPEHRTAVQTTRFRRAYSWETIGGQYERFVASMLQQ